MYSKPALEKLLPNEKISQTMFHMFVVTCSTETTS